MKKTNHVLSRQPKWVQNIIQIKNREIEELRYKLEQAEKANEITSNMDWHTLGFHTPEERALYLIDKDSPRKICTFGGGYIVLIGRPKK